MPGELAILCSAKEGIGIEDILEAIVARVPPPKPTGEASLQALAFDSYFDTYKGVVTHVRIFNGEVKAGMKIKLMHSGKNYEVKEVGSFNPKPYIREKLETGETGYITANIKSAERGENGRHHHRCAQSFAGAAGVQGDSPDGVQRHLPDQHGGLRASEGEHGQAAAERLGVRIFRRKRSVALGFGFRCGFLGLLHMEIVQERLRREYDMDIIATYPSVVYHVTMTDGTMKEVDNPAFLPDAELHRENRGADGEGVRHLPERKYRRHDGADRGKARRGGPHGDAGRQARDADEHAAAE